MRVGFGQADITPDRPVLMPGYFTKRVSSGVLHPIAARAAVFEDGPCRAALIALELIGVPGELVGRVRAGLGFDGYAAVVANHTHTGPAVQAIFGMPVDEAYVSGRLLPGIAQAVAAARAGLEPCELAAGSADERGLAFCRRYRTPDGRVVTNPPAGSACLATPEGEPDHAVTVLAARRGGALKGLIVHAANHCDSTGGTEIGPDWTGFMADALAQRLGADVPVLFLPGPQGDVNHFDPGKPRRSSPETARALGRAYAEVAVEAVGKSVAIEGPRLRAHSQVRPYPRRHVDEALLEDARRKLAAVHAAEDGMLNSEDLARGHDGVELFFARQAVALRRLEQEDPKVDVEVGLIALDGVRLLLLPFETFSQTARNVTAGHGAGRRILVTSLANGSLGYVAPPECYARGGYETRVGSHSPLGENAEPLLKAHVAAVLAEDQGSSAIQSI